MEAWLKTKQPFILTAHIPDNDLGPYDSLRQLHFPPERNFLRAHLTMFHRLPGEHLDKITAIIAEISARYRPISAQVTALRHLGAGVAFTVFDPDLLQVHAAMRTAFSPGLAARTCRSGNRISRCRTRSRSPPLTHCS